MKIMQPGNANNKNLPEIQLPDNVMVMEPKELPISGEQKLNVAASAVVKV